MLHDIGEGEGIERSRIQTIEIGMAAFQAPESASEFGQRDRSYLPQHFWDRSFGGFTQPCHLRKVKSAGEGHHQ